MLRSLVIFAVLGAVSSADAHGIAGNRFFPGTITFDDPAVADEFFVAPSGVKQPLSNGSSFNVLDTAAPWSFARLLTPDIAFQVSGGWIHNSAPGLFTQAGFDQTSVEIKTLLYKNKLHETLISASLGWGIGGSGSQRVGANAPTRSSREYSSAEGLAISPTVCQSR